MLVLCSRDIFSKEGLTSGFVFPRLHDGERNFDRVSGK
jgi:hypothetical protein